jgi:hypothetical protein
LIERNRENGSGRGWFCASSPELPPVTSAHSQLYFVLKSTSRLSKMTTVGWLWGHT